MVDRPHGLQSVGLGRDVTRSHQSEMGNRRVRSEKFRVRNLDHIIGMACVVSMCSVALTGCKEESPGVPRPPASSPPVAVQPSASPANDPHAGMAAPRVEEPAAMADVDTSGVGFTDERFSLTGLDCPIPVGWKREQPSSGMRKAQFRLAKADNEPEDVVVVITHFPGMKGMDDNNLRRWYGQFTQPDGRPTVESVHKTTYQLEGVVVTLVDIPGTMGGGSSMMGGGATKENYRMLAAIIDHAQGPHFLKLTGPSAGVERWKASGVAFLKGIKVKE